MREVGRRIGYENLSQDDIRIIDYVGKIVAIRAAVLTSTRELAVFSSFFPWPQPLCIPPFFLRLLATLCLPISYFIEQDGKHEEDKRKRSINAR